MDSTQIELIMAAMRHLLTALGGVLVTKGVTDSSTVESIAGGAVALIGLIWSAHQKHQQASTVNGLKTQLLLANNPLTPAVNAPTPPTVNVTPTTPPTPAVP